MTKPSVVFAHGLWADGSCFSKLIPTQMPTLFLSRLVEPFGNFSPMGVLWTSIGASPVYESFTGAVELLGGVLLFFPQTTLLGSLICLIGAGEVFVLNMTYDVPVKLLSLHLVLMALILAAPYAGNLFDLLVRHRPLTPVEEPPIGRTPRRRRLAFIAQAVYGVLLVLLAFSASLFAWSRSGPPGGRRWSWPSPSSRRTGSSRNSAA